MKQLGITEDEAFLFLLAEIKEIVNSIFIHNIRLKV